MKNREEYRAKAHHTVNKLFNSIDEVEKKIKQSAGEQKKQLESKLKGMQKTKKTLQTKVKELDKATEESWDEAKKGFEAAKSELDQAWKEIKGKIVS